MNVLRGGDTIYLYNQTHQLYVAKTRLGRMPGTTSLTGIPLLTADAKNAGMLVLQTDPADTEIMTEQSTVLIRTVEESLGGAIFLGSNRNQSEMPPGQDVYFMAAENTNTRWRIAVGNERTSTPLHYGVPYVLHNYPNLTVLMSTPFHNRLVTQGSFGQASDQWVFLPTRTVFTCYATLGSCTETSGSRNVFSGLQCEAQGHPCTNRFQERVFFDNQECERTCGMLSAEPTTSTASTASITSPEPPGPPGSTSAEGKYLWIPFVLSSAVILWAFFTLQTKQRKTQIPLAHVRRIVQ